MQKLPVISTLDAVEEKETKDFDSSRLLPYLTKHLPDFDAKTVTIRRFSSGFSNAPYLLDCGTQKYVLRWDKVGIAKDASRLTMKEQYKLISNLSEHTDVPVAKMYLICADESIIGKSFYVQQFVEGRIFTHCGWHLPTIDKEERTQIWFEFCRILSLIHSVDVDKLDLSSITKNREVWNPTGLYNEFGKYIDTAAKDESVSKHCPHFSKFKELMAGAMKKYDGNADNLKTLIHGDVHFENVIFHPTQNRIIAVVDWEFCTVGHPLMDLAYVCHMLFERFETESMKSIKSMSGMFEGVKKTDVRKLGLPTQNEFISEYFRHLSPLVAPNMMAGVISCFEHQNNWLLFLSLHFLRMFAFTYAVVAAAAGKDHKEEEKKEESSRLDDIPNEGAMYGFFDMYAEMGSNVYTEQSLDEENLANIVAPFRRMKSESKNEMVSAVDELLDSLDSYLRSES